MSTKFRTVWHGIEKWLEKEYTPSTYRKQTINQIGSDWLVEAMLQDVAPGCGLSSSAHFGLPAKLTHGRLGQLGEQVKDVHLEPGRMLNPPLRTCPDCLQLACVKQGLLFSCLVLFGVRVCIVKAEVGNGP